MAHTEVILYREDDGCVPLLAWLESLPRRARDDCLERLRLLEQLGYELRRPHAEYLRDGIYELRAKRQGVNYRMLYFFYGRSAIVVSHGVIKQQAHVPEREIERAIKRETEFRRNPSGHSFRGRR